MTKKVRLTKKICIIIVSIVFLILIIDGSLNSKNHKEQLDIQKSPLVTDKEGNIVESQKESFGFGERGK